MHDTIRCHLAQDRIAGLRHHAQRDTLAPAVLACALGCCAGSVPFLAPPRPLSPPWLATHPLAESAPPMACPART
jgi:hypothetical protein